MSCTAKKTTKLIIEGGNDYVITVKGNQPRLLTQLKTIAEDQKPCERFVDIEKTRGRITLLFEQLTVSISLLYSLISLIMQQESGELISSQSRKLASFLKAEGATSSPKDIWNKDLTESW